MPDMAQVHVSQHPLAQHVLAQLRDQGTPPPVFRKLVHDLAQMVFFEAAADMPLVPVQVTTPLTACPAQQLADPIGLVPILRAGLGMAESILEMVPQAQVWHLGLYRDHKTHQPITYYNKLAGQPGFGVCFVVDPMLATGGSAIAARDRL
jgi:uracil phosphoribosyltransferase